MGGDGGCIQQAPGIWGSGIPYAARLVFCPESFSLWLTVKLCSFARVGLEGGGRESAATHRRPISLGELLLSARVDHTARAELTVCRKL